MTNTRQEFDSHVGLGRIVDLIRDAEFDEEAVIFEPHTRILAIRLRQTVPDSGDSARGCLFFWQRRSRTRQIVLEVSAALDYEFIRASDKEPKHHTIGGIEFDPAANTIELLTYEGVTMRVKVQDLRGTLIIENRCNGAE